MLHSWCFCCRRSPQSTEAPCLYKHTDKVNPRSPWNLRWCNKCSPLLLNDVPTSPSPTPWIGKGGHRGDMEMNSELEFQRCFLYWIEGMQWMQVGSANSMTSPNSTARTLSLPFLSSTCLSPPCSPNMNHTCHQFLSHPDTRMLSAITWRHKPRMT